MPGVNLTYYCNVMRQCWDGDGPDLVSVIYATRGWLPPEVGEKAVVHFNGKEYVIERTI